MRFSAVKTHRRTRIILKSALIPVAALFANTASAQLTSAVTFDIDRFSDYGAGWFETFYVEETQSLQSALDAELVGEDTALLITETDAGQLALITDQMAFHHIAEGTVNGKDWMATF